MTPLWDELSETADRLAVDGQVSIKDLRTLRAAAVQMGNWFEANQELREERDRLQADNATYRAALNSINEAASLVASLAGTTAHEMGDATFARDFAPFINLMGIHHKDPDYGTPTKPTGHIDTKSVARRKTKVTA
jgi:hypothetical protein